MRGPRPISRRTFIQVTCAASGGLLIGVSLDGCVPEPPPAIPTTVSNAPTVLPTAAPTAMPTIPPTAAPTVSPTIVPTSTPAVVRASGPFEANMFVRIDPDGAVILTIHRSEMGQGVRTALAMILAEELDADWSRVRVEQALANFAYGSQTTSGSGSMIDFYHPLRAAGAAGRRLLITAAAQIWGVPTEACLAMQGNVMHPPSGRQAAYGDLAGVAAQLTAPTGPPPLKDSTLFRLIGTSPMRVDEPAIVRGTAVYGLDVRLPGMRFATVARCPVPGGKLLNYDDSRAKRVPGVRAIVEISNGVAVVADHTWAALQGRAALTLNWDEGELASVSSEALRRQLIDLARSATTDQPADDLTTIDAVYETPYLAHAPMEPLSCVADVRSDGCTIWAATQNPQVLQDYVRRVVSVPTEVHVTLMGGGFGRRLEVDYAVEAAEVSKAIGAPVQVIWSRSDDVQHDFYRPATAHWLRAGWDQQGNLAFWRHVVAAQGLNGIVYHAGNDVIEEGLNVPYQIADKQSLSQLADIALPTGPWRAVYNGPNAFANECFLDEVAHALHKDPYELRMQLIPDGDLLRPVVEHAAQKANWGAPLPKGRGRGIACHTTYGQTAVAMVAEASLEAGVVRVHRVVCAVDCGLVIHPDMVAQQIEGGIAYGLSALLHGEITFSHGRVQQSNLTDYRVLAFREMPEVEVYLLPSNRNPQGIGEMAVPPIAPAVANALYAAAGVRVRRMPLKIA